MFLLPVPVLRTVFRNKFLAGLRQLHRKGVLNLRGPAALSVILRIRAPDREAEKQELVRPCRAALRRPRTCAALPRPLHPSHGHQQPPHHRLRRRARQLPLARLCPRRQAAGHDPRRRELPRRFFLHVLPKGFVRIRRYGLLSNRFRKQLLPLARTLLAEQGRQPLPLPPLPDCAPWHCPRCGKAMRVVQRFTAAELISQASIPHEHRRQPLRRLAPCTSLRQCAHRAQNSSIATLNRILKSAPSQIALPPAHRCPSSTTNKTPKESLAGSPNAIQYP